MKTLNKLSILGGVVLASVACNLSAQTAAPAAPACPAAANCPAGGDAEAKEGRHGKHNPMEKLNLTEEQKAKVGPILEKTREDAKAVRSNDSLTPEQKKQQIQAIHQSADQQLQAILTPEQYQKLQEIKAERKEKHSKGDKNAAPATT